MDDDVLNECFRRPEKEKFRNSYCLFQRTCKFNKQCYDNMIVNYYFCTTGFVLLSQQIVDKKKTKNDS